MFSKKSLKIALFPLSALFLLYFSVLLFVGTHVYKDNKVASDAIIVLGAKATYNDKDNPCLVSRISHGVELYKEGYAQKILVSGGSDEAVVMKEFAKNAGIPEENILEESEATSTYENFAYSKAVMEQNNIKSLLIVTEPFHAPRASLIAEKLSIPSTVSPALDSPCWNMWKFLSRYFLREPFVIILYKLEGKL